MTNSRKVPPELLATLRRATGRDALAFSLTPTLIPGGNETSVFGFRLSDIPTGEPWGGDLILRVFDREQPTLHVQHRLEAAVQRFLRTKGFPVPVMLHVQDAGDGPAWVVMTRLEGTPLGSGEALRLPGGLFRLPSLIGDASRTMSALREQLHAIDAASLRDALANDNLTVPGISDWLQRARDRAGPGAHKLRAALDRLEDTLVPWQAAAPPVICHYDFHPLNILFAEGRVSGVIDWGGVTIAPREFDIANTVAVLTLVSLVAPIGVRQLMLAALRRLAQVYIKSAGPLDRRKLDEVVALRALVELVGMRQRGGHEGDVGSWQEHKLVHAVERATGIRP